MITNLKISNFKSLKEVDLELKNLNLLTGLNSTGKSSVIEILRILRQYGMIDELLLRGEIDISSNLLYSQQIRFYTEVDFEDNKNLLVTSAHSTLPNSFNGNKLNVDLFLKSPLPDGQIFSQQFSRNTDDVNATGSNYYLQTRLNEESLFNNKYQYLNTERLFLKEKFYNINTKVALTDKMLGEKGEHTAFYLNVYGLEKRIDYPILLHPKVESNYLLHQVNAWLSEISPNISVVTELKEDTIRIFFKYGNMEVEPKNVGFGLSYVLPVIVALLTAEKGKLIIIENPESHIHPRGQAELGRLIALAAQTEAQIIVETHSDHILNGIRVAVKEKLVSPDKVVSYYFKRDEEENCSQITPVIINEKGKLFKKTNDGTSAELPKGFFDEWTNSMFKLL